MTLLAGILLAPALAWGGGTTTTSGGLVWSLPPQLGGSSVAIAERGGQVLVQNLTTGLRLVSSFDSSPPTPVWQSYTGSSIVAARDTDVFLSADMVKISPASADCLITKSTSSSGVPAWTHVFAEEFPVVVACAISRDGHVIIASVGTFSSTSELRVLDPDTGAAIRTFVIPANLYRLALSPDGSVAAFSGGGAPAMTRLIDLATGNEIFATPGIVPRKQGLSDQGKVLLVQERQGADTHSRAFVRDGGSYRPVFDVRAAATDSSDMVVSDDGTVVAGAWLLRGTPVSFVVRAFDVATGTMSMERGLPPANVGAIAISSDGQRFVLGARGGASKLAVYSPTRSTPLVEYNEGGAVIDADLSPDGQRFVAARSSGGSSSSVELYEFGGEDFVVRGRPSIGETIAFELHATAGANAFLLSAPQLAPDPIVIAGIGTLFLGPRQLEVAPIGVVPPSGVTMHSLPLANDPALIGRTTYYQGFTTFPRTLSSDWVQLTILP